MKILNYFIPFIHKAKTFPRLLFLSSIVMCWFGNALSAYANDGNCHAIYSVLPNGSTNVHVPCVVLDSTSDDTVYEFDLNQVSKDEPLSFTVENIKPTTSTVSGEKATFNEATGVLILPLVEARDTADQTTHYAAQMLVSPTSDNQSRLVVSSITPIKVPNIAVCHIPSGNPAGAHTIYISMNTYENTHKAHGDTLGECGSSSPDDQGNTDNGDTGTDNTGSDGTGTDGTDNTGSDGTGTDGTDNTGSDGTGTGGTDNTGGDGTGTDGTDNTGSDGTGTDGTDNAGGDGTGTDGTDNTGSDGTGTDGTDNTGSEGTGTDTDNAGSEGTGTDDTGNDGTGGDGIVTAYSISGYVRDIKDKSNISLNTISSEISTSKIDNDGKYVFNLSEAEYQSILDNGFAYVKVGNETLRGLILGLSKFSNSYSGSDTDISYYSEALFRIKDALGLDLNATKVLYKDFLQSYNNGIYELNDYSYSFAFRDIIEELAENIRENLSNNTPLISHDEIISKIKLLNHLEVSDFHKATRYSFPLLSTENDRIVLTITSFKNHVATDDFTANMEVIVKNDSPFYDNAFLTKINFSDASVVLKDVNVKTFVVDINKQVLFNDEYKDTFKEGNNSQVVENNKIQLIFNNDTRLREAVVKDNLTDIYYDEDEKKAYVKLVFDLSKLSWYDKINNYDLYVNVSVYDYDDQWSAIHDPDNDSNIIDLTKDRSVYEYDFTKLLNRFNGEDKHLPVLISLYDSDPLLGDDDEIKLTKTYGFIDWNNDYQNSTIAKLTLKDTLRGSSNTTSYGDNVFDNSKGHEKEHVNSTPTHRIIDFDKIVEKDILIGDTTNKPWKYTDYAVKYKDIFQNDDERKALLLIHGWQGGDGLTYPSKLLRYEHSEFEYWHNFISYYLATPKVYNKYKLYTYHYPSYKHVTYNARMLKVLKVLLEQKTDTSSVLGKGFNSDGVVIIGHSMGGLVARSFIEEHKALGNDAEKLTKLITLDTPHHGSPSSISNYWLTQLADILSKDFDTPGAVDLLWDNYDNKYSKDDGHFKATVTNISNGDSRRSRMHELEGYGGSFDDHYGNNLMNPYLKKVNEQNHSFSKDKYVIYTAVTPYGLADHKLKNPIDNDNGMILNTQLLNGIGYAAGGAEPMCSSLFSFQTEVDNITRFTTSMNDLANIPPNKKFIIIENDGDEHNRNIPYRIFWDYDHETIMNGQISKGNFDKYIDSSINLTDNEIGKKTNFSDLRDSPFDYGTARKEYINFANEYLEHGTNDRKVDEDTDFVSKSSANPLKQEPVFLVLQKDLLDADESPTVPCEPTGIKGGTRSDTECLEEPTPTIGASCGYGKIYDCVPKCVSAKDAQEWQGDGSCDDGTKYDLVLTCPHFNNDGGDCDIPSMPPPPPPGPTPKAGASCGSGYIYDCILHCVNASYAADWKGDGNCDDGEYGIVLTCPAFNNDDEDCKETEPESDTDNDDDDEDCEKTEPESNTDNDDEDCEKTEPESDTDNDDDEDCEKTDPDSDDNDDEDEDCEKTEPDSDTDAQPYPPTKIIKDSTLSGNPFSANQGTWYAYGRVMELVDLGHLLKAVGDRIYNAFNGKTGRHSKNWPTFLVGDWVKTDSANPLPKEKRRRGLLAVWSDGDYGHVGFVEEVNADKTQYRLSSFNRVGGKNYQDDWYSFEGNSFEGGVLKGDYYPQFYNLTEPNW